MNGHPLLLSGGTNPFFLSSDGYQPGSLVGGEGTLYLYSTVIWVNGIATEFYFPPGSIFMTPFTLPTNDTGFKFPVQIGFFISGINYDTGRTIDLSGGGSGYIPFYFSNATGLYYAGSLRTSSRTQHIGINRNWLSRHWSLTRKRTGLLRRQMALTRLLSRYN